MLVLSALLPPRVRTRTGHTWLIHLATVTEAILNPYKSYTSPLPIASVRSLSTYPALSFSLVKSVSASFSNAVHAVAIHSRQQLSGLGILGKPDSPNSWTEVVRGRFAYRLPNLFCFFSAGFKIWNEHSRDSSTLIMAPALSNSPQ